MTDQELIDHICSAFALTSDEIQRLAQAIAQAYQQAYQSSVRQALQTIGASPLWEAGPSVKKKAEEKGQQDAASIAQTYREQIAAFLRRELETKGWQDLYSTVGQALHSLSQKVGAWLAATFIPYKTKQVANFTTGAGFSAGTTMIARATQEASEDGPILDEDGALLFDPSTIDASVQDMGVQVLPEESANDVCATLAGRTFTLDEYQDVLSLVGEFPLHPNCRHYSQVVPL